MLDRPPGLEDTKFGAVKMLKHMDQCHLSNFANFMLDFYPGIWQTVR